MKKIIHSNLYILVFLFSSCSASNKDDFSNFCHFVSELEKTEKFTPENLSTNFTMLIKHVEDVTHYGEALKSTFSNAQNLNADDKYEYFKESAELTTKESWECQPLKRFYSTTEYNKYTKKIGQSIPRM